MKSLTRKSIFFSLLLLLVSLFVSQSVYAADTTTYAAFQPFEGGYMIWRGDNGGIWVLYNDGRAHFYAQAAFENLPDNPVTDSPPAKWFKPVNGFGRIWGNFPAVRQALGWALAEETGYTPTFSATPVEGGWVQTQVNFPYGQRIVITGLTWKFAGQNRQPTHFAATLQAFEGGYMLWWSHTGDIWVLTHSGRATVYSSIRYGQLLDNPITTSPPDGRIKPIMGFGKVWGNFPEVRQAVGWAVDRERGYQMLFERNSRFTTIGGSAFGFIVSHPDGRQMFIWDNDTWHFG